MKLRIKGNSIRFRLLRSEVKRLEAAGTISDEIRFGVRNDQSLRYSIMATDGVDIVSIDFSDSQILVLLPEMLAHSWCTGDEISIEHNIEIDEETTLKVSIEKDMVCLDRPDDPDNADAYPNPKTDC